MQRNVLMIDLESPLSLVLLCAPQGRNSHFWSTGHDILDSVGVVVVNCGNIIGNKNP